MSDQFLSVPTMITGRFRMVPEADSPRLCTGFAHAGNAALREEALMHSRQNDAMMRFLVEMDRKLDAIMGLLQRESLHVDFPDEGRVVHLGGSGLVFECRRPLRQGEHMELLLLLEELPLRLLSVIAHVESPLPDAPLTGAPNKAYAMTYTCMQEEDREAIIRFVFSENRKIIRQRKIGDD